MPKRDVIVVGVAVLIGAIAFVLLTQYVNKNRVAKQRFVIAAQDIPADHLLTEADLTLSAPQEAPNAQDLFLQAQDAIGSTTLKPIAKDTEVLRSDVEKAVTATENEVVTPSGSLAVPAGMRSFTLSSEEVDNIPDILKPGSYLDIMGNVTNYEGTMELQTVIRGSQVLTVDKDEEGKINAFTVSLTRAGTEIISKAISQGRLRLILRSDNTGGFSQIGEFDYVEIIRGITKEKNMRRFTSGDSDMPEGPMPSQDLTKEREGNLEVIEEASHA